MLPSFARRYFAAALSVLALAACPAFAAPPTTVTVAGEVFGTLPLPTPLPIVLRIEAHARGEAADDLSGAGTQVALHAFPPPGGIIENSSFDIEAGEASGSVVLLSGTVQTSSAPIAGSPVALKGDASTQALTFTLGPISAGVFVGQTIVFEGFGTIVVNTR